VDTRPLIPQFWSVSKGLRIDKCRSTTFPGRSKAVILIGNQTVIDSLILRTGEVITVCCQVSPVAGRGATIETRRGFQPTVIDWAEFSSSRSDD
jgi:hypothetical protein